MGVKELEKAIQKLSSDELAEFKEWFEEYQASLWDEQIERDAQAGRLDHLIEEADREFEAGNCKPL